MVLFDIERNSFVDGPGIRTTVFFKGCNLRCAWCHNPESQSFEREMMFYKNKCTGCGKCKKMCPNPEKCAYCGKCEIYCPVDARKICGREYAVEEVFSEIIKDKPYYENSGGGVTFSGGECMLQTESLLELLKICKENGIHTAVDTAGHVEFKKFEKVLPYTDLFLYDVKIFDNEKHKKYIGTGNELILENLKKLSEKGAGIWVRVPVIAGVNDDFDEMKKLSVFLKEEVKPVKVELLPYHAMGENKYFALGKNVQTFTAPDAEKMNKLKELFV